MADSGSLRVRRHRLHTAGDHSLCRRCAAMRPAAGVAAPDDGLSPVRRLGALASRLEAAHVADPANSMVARELRLTLESLAKAEPPAADLMGELRAIAAGVS